MAKFTKIISVFCIILLLSTVFAGCANQADNQAGPSAEENKSTAETPPAPVNMRFSWWGSDVRNKATLAAISAYEQKNSNITIEGEYSSYDGYQKKLMTQLASNSAPDLMQYDPTWIADLTAQGDNLADFSKEDSIDLTQFDENILTQFCSTNGKLVGLPLGAQACGTVLSKPFFEKFGLSMDTEWTWDKLIDEGKRIHDQDGECYLFALDPVATAFHDWLFSTYIYSKTGKYWVDNNLSMTVSKADFVDVFTFIKNLFDSGTITPFQETAPYASKMEQLPKFVNGQVGIFTTTSSILTAVKSVQDPGNITVGKNIFVKGGNTENQFRPAQLIGLNNKCSNVNEAAKFVNWFLNNEEAAMILTDVRSTPMSKSTLKVLQDANKLDADIVKMVDNALSNPQPPSPMVLSNPEVINIVFDIIQQIAFNKITPDQAADKLEKSIQDKLNELKASK